MNPKISIVLNNYNYAKYAALCVDSALTQSYENVEVIVVDDGSTDDSWEILQAYWGRVILERQENAGQGAAYNRGFELSSGEIVCFLDSDDFLDVDACRRIAALDWTGVAKIQARLQIVDGDGRLTGGAIPFGRADEDTVHKTWSRFGRYNAPPGSGNFYHRTFLEKTLPMDPTTWRIAADAFLILQAPFYGRVKFCPDTVGFYRIHGNNASSQTVGGTGDIDVHGYATKELFKEVKCQSLVKHTNAALGGHQCAVRNTPSMLKLRVARYRTSSRERRQLFYRWTILKRAVYVTVHWEGYSRTKKAGFLAWTVAVLLLPLRQAVQLISRTIYPYKRGF